MQFASYHIGSIFMYVMCTLSSISVTNGSLRLVVLVYDYMVHNITFSLTANGTLMIVTTSCKFAPFEKSTNW